MSDRQRALFAAARPSFARIGVANGRVGVIDVGSNSVRLVVFDQPSRAPGYFFNEKVSCGLGSEIARTGRLAPEGREKALETLRRFAALAMRMKVAALDAIATAAVREAEDGPDFVREVARETGLRLSVIDGDEEARLSALGVLLGAPGARGAACDMGGASMELAALEGDAVGGRITLALGPQRLAGLSGDKLRRRIDAELDRGAEVVPLRGAPLYIVGGAWRAFAKLHMERVNWPLRVLQGYRMDVASAASVAEWIETQSADALKSAGASSGRAATAPVAATVLRRICERLEPSEIRVSALGLREGAFFDRMPASVRASDPLIDACRRLEANQARFPGFGEELAGWIDPALSDWSADERRLARAAALLNDVNWRAHPDYRAVSCFETMTRGNLSGLDHADRVFVGFALMNRYGGGKRSADVEEALGLIEGERRERAKALGRGLRLGAMVSASTPGALADIPLRREERRLTLRFERGAADLAGSVVERRFGAFADALGLEPALERATR